MISGNYINGTSVIHTLNAGVKTLSLFLLMTAVITSTTFYSYIAIILILAIILKVSCLPVKLVLSPLRRLWHFFILIFIMNTLFFGTENPLFTFGIINITYEGIIQGIRVVFNVIYIMILANILTGTTTPMDITAGISFVLKPLKLLRIPTEDIAMIISIAFRFVPVLMEEALIIKKAQIARGARFESKKLKEKALSYLPLLIPIFLSAFRRADELALAMEARGYRSAGKRTNKAFVPFRFPDYFALGCSITICILINIF